MNLIKCHRFTTDLTGKGHSTPCAINPSQIIYIEDCTTPDGHQNSYVYLANRPRILINIPFSELLSWLEADIP